MERRHQRSTTTSAGGSAADRLADAAITVIARDGLDGLSVRAAARQAGVTGGAIQHHFPTKNELTLAALDRAVRRIGGRAAATTPPPTIVGRLVRELCSILPSDPPSREEAVVWIAMSAAVTGNDAIATRYASAVDQTRRWIASAVRRAIEAGEVDRPIDPVEIAPLIEAALDGMMLQAIAAEDSHDVLCARLATIVTTLLR